MHCSSRPFHGNILPSTHSWSTRVCTWADLRPTQKVASTKMATKRTFPAWRCRKQPNWNNWLWRRALSQSAARSPVALPWNNMVTTVTLLIWCVDAVITTDVSTELFAFDSQKEDGSKFLRKAWTVTTSTWLSKFVLLELQLTSAGIWISSVFVFLF